MNIRMDITIGFDGTDPDSVAAALDGLMDIATSTDGVLDSHGEPTISEFFVGDHDGNEVGLWLDVEYDPRATDPDMLASSLDTLMETATSTPGVLCDCGITEVGGFTPAKRE